MQHRSTRALALAVLVPALLVGGSTGSAQAHSHRDWSAERAHVKDRARRQLGAPYRYGGTSPSGFDCSGYTRWVYLDHGANLPHSSSSQFALGSRPGYRRIWERKNLEIGDLVFHRTSGYGVSHAGMYVGRGRFISSTSSGGVRIRSLYDSYWGRRWAGGTRLPATIRYSSPRRGSRGSMPVL